MSSEERVRDEALVKVVTEVLAPMIEADRGHIEFVARRESAVELVLSGSMRGCPGLHYTVKYVVLPALQAVDPTVLDVKVLTRKPQ